MPNLEVVSIADTSNSYKTHERETLLIYPLAPRGTALVPISDSPELCLSHHGSYTFSAGSNTNERCIFLGNWSPQASTVELDILQHFTYPVSSRTKLEFERERRAA